MGINDLSFYASRADWGVYAARIEPPGGCVQRPLGPRTSCPLLTRQPGRKSARDARVPRGAPLSVPIKAIYAMRQSKTESGEEERWPRPSSATRYAHRSAATAAP